MALDMKAVFHYGKDSQRFIRRFQELRVELVIGRLRAYPAEELRLVRDRFIHDYGTFVAEWALAV